MHNVYNFYKTVLLSCTLSNCLNVIFLSLITACVQTDMKKSPTKFNNQEGSRNIMDMLKKQGNLEVACPACGFKVLKSKLNFHLDTECSSVMNNTSKESSVIAKGEKKSNVKKTKSDKILKSVDECFKRATVNATPDSDSDFVVTKISRSKKTVSCKANSTVWSTHDSKSVAVDGGKGIKSVRQKQVTNIKKVFPTSLHKKSKLSKTKNTLTFSSHGGLVDQNSLKEIDDELIVLKHITNNNAPALSSPHTKKKISVASNNFLISDNKSTPTDNIESKVDESIVSNCDKSIKESVLSFEDELSIIESKFQISYKKNTPTQSLPIETTKQTASNVDTPILPLPRIKRKLPMTENNSGSIDTQGVVKKDSTSLEFQEPIIPRRAINRNKPVPSLPQFKRKVLTDKNKPITKNEMSANIKESLVSKEMSDDNISESQSVFDEEDNSLLNDVFETTEDNATENETPVTHVPYYIANFKYIVDKVLNDEYNKHLFDDTDLKCVQDFNSLSDAAKKLYVRLFQRKYKWLRPSSMRYSEISDDLICVLNELAKKNFLDIGADHLELEAALNLLSLSEAKSLSKHFNFNASSKSKTEIIQLLIKHGKQHKSFFFSGNSSVSSAILKKVKQVLGPCYRLTLEPKRLFTRILMLFSLPTISEDDEEAAGGQQQQLLTLLQVNKGELIFPEYKLCRKFQIFEDRDSLIRYESARQIENDILSAIESKKFEKAKDSYIIAKEEFEKLCQNDVLERDKTMPFYLRRYSACHVYTRCLYQGVEILQRLRQYEEAVVQLQELLEQKVYCQDRRGKWYDRLALNLDQHLKERKKAVECIKEALQDSYVRVGLRHSLLLRAERLKKNKKDDDELNEYVCEMSGLIKAPSVTIKGRLIPRPIPGRRHVFVSSTVNEDSGGTDVSVLAVEEVAIEHYRSEGYVEGIHGEGSTFISLYTLLFWDIIYDGNIPDAFISPYQTHPLDLNSDDFHAQRKSQIMDHIKRIRNSSTDELCEIVRSTWIAHNGQASLVSWDKFVDVEHIVGLVSCFGSSILAGICERLSKDFRFTRSGVPDLVVWNPTTKLVKVAEVKGPGDKLSSKQILWLDYLIKIGADAEVCLVEAFGSKKLRRE